MAMTWLDLKRQKLAWRLIEWGKALAGIVCSHEDGTWNKNPEHHPFSAQFLCDCCGANSTYHPRHRWRKLRSVEGA